MALTMLTVACRANLLIGQQSDRPVVRSAYGTLEELFQTEVLNIGLEELGYEVVSGAELEYDIIHAAIAQNYLDYTAVHWNPLHTDFFEDNGGTAQLQRTGVLLENAVQGYLIDSQTAAAHNIKSLRQLQDPKLAKLFDSDGNGLANLVGCPAGWGCRDAIEAHLDTYNLRDTVEHESENYFASIEQVIVRHSQGQPVLYYTWTPFWLSSVLVPDEDVVWLTVSEETTTAHRNNQGFDVNQIEILASPEFLADHPTVARFFEVAQLPIEDVNRQNQRMRNGENTPQAIRRHAEAWVADNQGVFDGWLAEARAAKSR